MERYMEVAKSATPPVAPAAQVGYPTNGNPSTGTPASEPGEWWFHMTTEELRAVIAAAGITPAHDNLTQLLAALRSAGVFQTRPQFDNDTSAATTEFVKRALGSLSNVVSVSAAATLNAAHSGKLILVGGVTPFAITLPLWSEVVPGTVIEIQNIQPAGCTIQRQGSDVLQSGLGTFASYTNFNPGDSVRFVAGISAGSWQAVSGTLPLRDSIGPFGSSMAANGYQKLPSGLIVQWGTTASVANGGSASITYPIAFPTARICAVGSGIGTGINGSASAAAFNAGTLSGCTIYNWGAIAAQFSWLAVGY